MSAWKRAYTPISVRRTRAQKRKVINEPRLNPITHRGGIFWLMAMQEVPFAGAAHTIAASLVIHFHR